MKALIACLFLASTAPAFAALKVGAPAPDFTIPASQGGKEFTFRLADALKKGPVVVYFYPAAFTKGCSLEARAFAEAMPEYQARGASVIGFVGAGGIGQELYTVISFNYYQEIGAILTLIIITVSLIDMVSERLRVRAIGQAG